MMSDFDSQGHCASAYVPAAPVRRGEPMRPLKPMQCVLERSDNRQVPDDYGEILAFDPYAVFLSSIRASNQTLWLHNLYFRQLEGNAYDIMRFQSNSARIWMTLMTLQGYHFVTTTGIEIGTTTEGLMADRALPPLVPALLATMRPSFVLNSKAIAVLNDMTATFMSLQRAPGMRRFSMRRIARCGMRHAK